MTIQQLVKFKWEELLEWDEKKIEEHFAESLKVTRPPPEAINKTSSKMKQGELGMIPDGPIKPPTPKAGSKTSVKQTQAQALKLMADFQKLIGANNK